MQKYLDTLMGLRRIIAGVAAAISVVAQFAGHQIDPAELTGVLGGFIDALSLGGGAVAGVLALWSKLRPDAPPAQ